MNASAKDYATSIFGEESSSTIKGEPTRAELLRGIAGRKTVRRKGQESTDNRDPSATAMTAEQNSTVEPFPEYDPSPRFWGHPMFVALQEWEGWVEEVGDDEFTAVLNDMMDGPGAREEKADFPISDVVEKDLDLLKPGAVFRWSIGYMRDHGTKTRCSRIVFRRLPAWRNQDIEEAKIRAEEIAQELARR